MYEELNEVEKKFSITDFPLNVAIEPSNYCNLNCPFCAHDKLTRPKGAMNIYLYKKIIDEIAKENPYTRIWLDFYGEPLLVKYRLFYMIDYAKKSGLKNVAFNTNGTLLDEEMAEMLLDAGPDFISIDCEGFSKEVYEAARVNGDRDVTYKNIEYFLKRKKERNLDKPVIEVKVMEMPENQHEIDQIISYWMERGACICRRRMISWGGNCSDLTKQEVPNRIACGNAVGTQIVTWDGRATACVMDVDAKNAYGDINVESIKEVWQRERIPLIKTHLEHRWDNLPEMCKNCTDWTVIGEERFDSNGNPIIKTYDQGKEMI